MKLVLTGMALALAGLALLLGMTSRIIDPALGLSLVGFASTFGGTLLGVSGALRRR